MYHLIEVLIDNTGKTHVFHHGMSLSPEALRIKSEDITVKLLRLSQVDGGTGWQPTDDGFKLNTRFRNGSIQYLFVIPSAGSEIIPPTEG